MTKAIPQTGGFLVEGFKPVKITEVDVVYADRPGRNKNVYGGEVLREAIEYYKKIIELDPTYRYAFAKHPTDSNEEWMGLIAAAIDDIYYVPEKQVVRADFTLLPTIWGHFIAWLLDNEYKIGISLRGSADAEQATVDIGGKTIAVKNRSNLRLEGVDFVVYPSYIVTHASKSNVTEQAGAMDRISSNPLPLLANLCTDCSIEHSPVFESFVNSTAEECGIPTDDIKNLFNYDTNNEDNVRRNNDMSKNDSFDLEKDQLEHEKLTVQSSKLSHDIELLTEQSATATADAEQKRQLAEDLESKITEKQKIIAGLNALEDKLLGKQEELTSIEEKITSATTEFDGINSELGTIREKAENQMVVRVAGKTFSSDNPPKIRMVPVQERTTEADWDAVNQNSLRQLVALSQDEKVAESVFGVRGESWNNLKHPVYQAFKSDSEEYDIDMVMNRKGVQTSLTKLFGRSGMSLAPTQKRDLTSFLQEKYTELENAGISEIPGTIKGAHARLKILESLQFDEADDFAETVIETSLLNGLISLELEEKVTEQSSGEEGAAPIISINREIAYDNLSSAIMNTLLGINRGRITEQRSEEGGDAPEMQSFVDVLVRDVDGSPTEFAEAFEIEDINDFNEKYITTLQSSFENGDIATALSMVEMVVSSYTKAMAENVDEGGVQEYINTAFRVISEAIGPGTPEEEQLPEDAQEPMVPKIPESDVEPVQEQADDVDSASAKAEGDDADATGTDDVDATAQDTEASDDATQDASAKVEESTDTTDADDADATQDASDDAKADETTDDADDTKAEEDTTVDDTKVTEDVDTDTQGGDDEMLFANLKQVFESKFEDMELKSEEDVQTVVEKLITDYEQAYSELKHIELKSLKDTKISELREAGVDEKVIESELEGIDNIDELEEITSKLVNVAKNVQESKKDDALEPTEVAQKGHSHVQGNVKTGESGMSQFEKAMKTI